MEIDIIMTKEEYIKFLDGLNIERPKCKYCNNDIYYDNTKARITKKGIHISGKSYKDIKIVNGKEYHLCVCQECLLKKYKPTNLSRTFNVLCDATKYAYDISDEDFLKTRKAYGVTKEKFITKYGKEEGLKKWKTYCDIQAETNTFEYKSRVYGMTEKEFNEFNLNRAVTKKNLILKHGEEEGLKMWNDYIQKQKLTKSWNYMVEHFGEEKARQINASKAITEQNYIARYGEIEGKKRFIKVLTDAKCGFSKESQALFKKIDQFLCNKYETFYASKNYEYPIIGKDYNYKLDYYIPELKICIEYNGSCFHGESRIYKDTDYCNPFDKTHTALDIRKNDEIRYINLKKYHNIKTVVIWELDYKDKNFDLETFVNNNILNGI